MKKVPPVLKGYRDRLTRMPGLWKVITLGALLIVVSSGMLVSFINQQRTSAATCGGTDKALKQPATASSLENETFPASNAVDGDTATRWSSTFSDPQWLQIDLGEKQAVCRVSLSWEAAYGKAYQIQVSDDARTWTTIHEEVNDNGGAEELTTSGAGRYIRLYGTARGTAYGYSLYEFRVYTEANGGNDLISANKPATAASVQDDQDCQNCNAAKAVDGNTTTRWSSAFSDPQWLQIDLGTGALISRVVLNWEAAYGKAYQIQVSNDARTWTTIYTATNGNGGTDDLTVAGTGRYIRLYGTARGTAYGYSLYEFQVYGTAGAGGGDNGTPPAGWQMIWSDEFNSATGTTPDGSKWTPAIGGNGWGNQEREYYTNNNASQDGNGNLVIEARKENPANYQCWYGTCQYTSARLITQNKFEFTHGRVEARIKIPYGQGIWPSIWMMGNDIDSVGWPNNGEIDIFENIGREPATVHGTIHGPNYSGANGIGGAYTLSEGRFADDYHLFAAEWSSNAVDFFVDGNKYFTVTRATVEQHGNWVYDHPFYLLLNVAVGGGWPGDPDGSSTYPQKMSVDYIRVYQQN